MFTVNIFYFHTCNLSTSFNSNDSNSSFQTRLIAHDVIKCYRAVTVICIKCFQYAKKTISKYF